MDSGSDRIEEQNKALAEGIKNSYIKGTGMSDVVERANLHNAVALLSERAREFINAYCPCTKTYPECGDERCAAWSFRKALEQVADIGLEVG